MRALLARLICRPARPGEPQPVAFTLGYLARAPARLWSGGRRAAAEASRARRCRAWSSS